MSTNKRETEQLRTWVDIDTKAIAANYRTFRKLIGRRTKMLAVVKSNSYGHDIAAFSKQLEELGVDWLGVDSIVEALRLRKEGITTQLLVMGHILPVMLPQARKANIAVTVSSFDMLKEVFHISKGRSQTPLYIHVKIDTGMHRQGFQRHELDLLMGKLKEGGAGSGVHIQALYTHFAEAKDPRATDFTRRQIAEFGTWVNSFKEAGFSPIVHAGATGGTLLYPSAHFDMVRIGIGMYGIWPSRDAERHLGKQLPLRPVLSWKAVVSEVKEVQKGERIGYDLTEMLTRNTKIAVIPIGYWHGFPRALSGKARVLIGGKNARVLGRVSMDMIVVDVTDHTKVVPGYVATIIGRDGKEEVTATELAVFAGTSAYEIVTRLNPLMNRFYR